MRSRSAFVTKKANHGNEYRANTDEQPIDMLKKAVLLCKVFEGMKKLFFLLVMGLGPLLLNAQTDTKKIMLLLQECLSLNRYNQQDVLKLYEQVGMIEHTVMNFQIRIKLSDLQKAEVKKNNNGFAVEFTCSEDNKCISLIKNDTATTPISQTNFQFSDLALANTFAENIANLVAMYKTNEVALEKILYRNEEGKTPLLGLKRTPEQAKVTQNTPAKEDTDPDDEMAEKTPAAKQNGTDATAKMSKEEREEARQEKREELQRKAAERKEAREEQMASKKEARKNKKEESATDTDNDDEPQEKSSTKPKRKSSRQNRQDDDDNAAQAPEDDNREKPASTRKSKSSGNSLIEDIGDAGDGTEKTKAAKDFCIQLQNILQSGKDSQYKSIEGKLTNADKKINDSKVKLKGAKKNYLSWFKKERAFIAELKSGNDYEAMLKEFENLQTQLDECLGSNWDMEDRSGSEEYAKLKTEVKDVEFKHDSDDKMPAIRVIFVEDQDKFTLFIRIQ